MAGYAGTGVAGDAAPLLARSLHGLTWRRAGAIALFALVLGAFNGSVAISYARGLPPSQVALAFVQTYVGELLWLSAGLVAGVVAFNLVRAATPWRIAAAAIAVAGAVRIALPYAAMVRYAPWRDVMPHTIDFAVSWIANSLIAGLAVVTILYITQADDAERSLEAVEQRAADLARALDEARLQATQAQIEPHFLFNTLANIRRLYDLDRESARTMLRQFVAMLGETLPDIRTERSTLAREIALSRAYLNVQKIRMGERLVFSTDVPRELQQAMLPPMMLSTLVENAIKHGLAPLRSGGTVTIRAREQDGMLAIEVVDDGRGLTESSGNGVGLANIEARLAALYGRAGELSLEPNADGRGVTARLELPLQVQVTEVADAARVVHA